MGSVSLLSLNIDSLIKDLEDQNEVVAFVEESIDDESAAEAIGSELRKIENVQSVEFVSRKNAMAKFMSNYDSDLMEGIDETVFRHRFVVHLTDISSMAQTKARLEDVDGIAEAKAHTQYAKAFISIRNVVTVVSLVLIVILVFVSIFIMTNTIKLATISRKEEIAIMKMVGATNSFIRMPFVVEGLVLGLLGGGLAYLAEWGIYDGLTVKVVNSMSASYLNIIPFRSVAVYVLIIYLGLGIMVGVFGGMNAIRNYLKV
jgi:cell division transport system permease protein